jgi:phenylpyruvate tautomerase PptA (4-oxalocrotonate tautomerase family)
MPHITIKHFPAALTGTQRSDLVQALTRATADAFGCSEGVVSIAVEPVAEEDWNEQVYRPEIEDRKNLLWKAPNY